MQSEEQKTVSYLKSRYEKVRDYVSSSLYFLDYANEKFHHSMQVIGAMKYIMKHEKTFQNRDEKFLNFAKIATILHDVGRFEEIKMKFEASKADSSNAFLPPKINHGYLGYEILKNSSDYNDPRIYIPIKHHGGLNEDLYNDDEYKNIADEKIKKEIEEIIKLVRDADKAANFYLFTSAGVKLFPNLFPRRTQKQEDSTWKLAETAKEVIKNHRLMKTAEVHNYLDETVHLLAWIFDINYRPTYDLIIKNGSLKRAMEDALAYCSDLNDEKYIKSEVESYLRCVSL